MSAAAPLRIAIGDYPHTRGLKEGRIAEPGLALEFVEVKPMNKAFKPMVRQLAYDASEMALVTYLQARAYGKDIALLPAAMLGRFQHHCMLFNAERGTLRPGDLAGKRIGVRSYSQTTAVWLRGILQNDYDIDMNSVRWITYEDGHVAEAIDPPFAERAPAGSDMTKMLIDGEIDAAIYGAAMPDDARLQSVVPDPHAAAQAWYRKHGVVPVNHMVVVKGELARQQPETVAKLYRLLEAGKAAAGPQLEGGVDTVPFGKDANQACLEMLIGYAVQQQLIPRRLTVDELFDIPNG